MKILGLLLLSLTAQASPTPGSVSLEGSCTITRPSGSQTIPLRFTIYPSLSVLGYLGEDGSHYEINIANNGLMAEFERTEGTVVIGFGRADAEVRNPPILCPVGPEEVRRECEERNRRENPPFVPAPADRFTARDNRDGNVKYEILMGDGGPDQFQVTKVAIPADRVRTFEPVKIETPRAALGGVLASCSLQAIRY